MAITQTGSILYFAPNSGANTGTVSTTITVPGDAELVVVGVSSYHSVANYLTGGALTFTKGGGDTTMLEGSNLGDGDTSAFMAGLFYLVLPDTGTNKTLKWDWSGTDLNNYPPIFSVTFWKGIDTSDAVRSTSGAQNFAPPFTTGTLTAVTGDLTIAWTGFWCNGAEQTVDSWTNLTELAEVARAVDCDGAWATASPTGNGTVAVATTSISSDGGIVAIVFKAAAAGGALSVNLAGRGGLAGAGGLAGVGGGLVAKPHDLILPPPHQIRIPERHIHASW